MQTLLQLSPRHYLWIQVCMQLGFFQAQWEEYYTGALPHAAGNIGTTEVLYGMAVWSIASGVFGMLLPNDDGELTTLVYDRELPTVVQELLPSIPTTTWILGISEDDDDSSLLQVRHAIVLVWVYGLCGLSMLSLTRVYRHLQFQPNFAKLWWSAVSKLVFGPLLLAVVSITLLQPLSPSAGGIRYPSLCLGLVFCVITIKLVVFGMARMAYASLQLDVLPIIWGAMTIASQHLSSIMNLELLFPLMTVGYLVRLVWWTRTAISQLCHKLQIQAFRINNVAPHNDKKQV
jgi:hypothetical protein